MTDAWCWGAWRFGAVKCGGGIQPLFDSRAPERDGWRWCTDDGRVFHFWVCAGCIAREDPHATGPHTRIVEEWEHEYGALCRVVVTTERDFNGSAGVEIEEHEELAASNDFDIFADVLGALGECYCTADGHTSRVFVASEREAVSLAMLDAERLALEWSPPIDEEAA